MGFVNGDIFVTLYQAMKFRQIISSILLSVVAGGVSASDFFSTSAFRFVQKRGAVSYSVEVDFPVDGSAPAMMEVRRWICDILDVSAPQRVEEGNFQSLLTASWQNYLDGSTGSSRRIEIVRKYEDEDLVTFEASVVDKDSAVWRSEDCASFSKSDGHRIQPSEIFACGEGQIKQLMWQFRDDIPVGVSSPVSLVVGNAGFVDGWIVVIGPAEGYTGAGYRIRYEVAEPFLRGKKSGGYYARATR